MSDLVKRYRDLQISIGGCHDGYCVIRKPQGVHTNGGCNCLEDMKLHERSRVGRLLRYGQEMADRIEELEAKLSESEALLARALELALEECPFRWGTPSYEDWWHHRRTTIAELKGQDDGW